MISFTSQSLLPNITSKISIFLVLPIININIIMVFHLYPDYQYLTFLKQEHFLAKKHKYTHIHTEVYLLTQKTSLPYLGASASSLPEPISNIKGHR